jgi:CAAX amino terminal protease family.
MAPLPSLFWSILGVGFVFLAQEIAIFLESLMGIRPGSENTQMILSLIEQSPWMILTGTVFAPILEEIVFRKILFTAFLKRMNVMNAALASSLIFAAAHFEFEHLLLYTSVGLVFAALYQKTGRIMSPIFCHIFMNAIVILARYA